MKRVLLIALAVAAVGASAAAARTAFVPNDPLVGQQYYLSRIAAFDFWPEPPALTEVKVAVIDSGIDGAHPEFAGRIADARSFVGGDPRQDELGHGTVVAGIIAANANNRIGIAGIGINVKLLVAKVVDDDNSVSLEAEVAAIRWAVDAGARVINLSLGGTRDPDDPTRDEFSPVEEAALEYAHRRGVLVVAAIGNADQAPRSPWPYASWPAALPHVLGVSATDETGAVPDFSNRDAVYNDLAAPGVNVYSTAPLALRSRRVTCANPGYTECAPVQFREGTSFAAPQVAAAAALVLGIRPALRPEQVAHILERSAVDANAATGCLRCPAGRDALSGWGNLNVFNAANAATTLRLPPADRFEPNDDAGPRAQTFFGAKGSARVTIDFWDDQLDVYRLRLNAGQRLVARATGRGRGVRLALWRPGTQRLAAVSSSAQRVARSTRVGAAEQLSFRVPANAGGWYYVEVRAAPRVAGPYTFAWTKTTVPAPRP